MAEGPTTYSGQRVDELLRCPICLDRFRNPKILPCQHTFCVSPCLEHLVDLRSRLIRCPECRAEHIVPRGGADGFPNNLIISNFLDLQPQQVSEGDGRGPIAAPNVDAEQENGNKCAVCEKQADTSKCVHCSKMVCNSCRKSHITQLKFDIGRLVNQIRRGLPKLSESIAESEQRSEAVKQQVEAVKSEVRDVVARYIKQLKDREKLLNSELDTFLQGESRGLRLKQENVEVELASISSYCDSTEGLLNQAAGDTPDAELMAIKAQCNEYMKEIRSTEVNSDLNTKLVKLETDGQRMNSAISNFGSLVVTTPGTSRGPQGSNRGRGRGAASSNNRTRQRWSSPQPLHELYTRDPDTPPPVTPPPAMAITASPHTTRPNPNHVGIGPHNEHLIPSYLRSTYNQNRPVQSPTHNHLGTRTNTSRYMYRMGTSPDNPFHSPRQGRISAIFGGYTPEPDPQPSSRSPARPVERSPGVFMTHQPGGGRVGGNRGRGQNRSNIQIAPVNANGSNNDSSGFPGRSNYPDVETVDAITAQPQRTPSQDDVLQQLQQRQIDNREPVAFSVDFDDGPNRRGRRRPPHVQRNQGRNQNRRHQRSRVRGQNSEPQPGPSNAAAGPPPVVRNRTFVMDEAEAVALNSSNNNNNNSNGGDDNEIDRPVINIDPMGTEHSGELNSVNIEMMPDDTSPGDTFTLSRPSTNYKRKSQVKKIIGGSRGNGAGKFTWPRGVAISPNNDSIVVADSSNHRVQVFDCNGEFVSQFGSFGTEDGQFDCLAGVASNRDGDIIVADRYNHRIQIFDRYGHLKKTFGREGIGHGQLSYPWGLTVDNSRNIFVVDKENHRIQVFNSQGQFVRVFGTFGHEAGHFNHPSYIALTPDNKVVVSDTDNHRIQIFSAAGEHLSVIGTQGSEQGQLQNPKGVAVDGQGFIVIADSGNNRIQVFRSDGRFYTTFGSHGNGDSQFKAIEGVAIMSDGKVVVCDKENHRLQLF